MSQITMIGEVLFLQRPPIRQCSTRDAAAYTQGSEYATANYE